LGLIQVFELLWFDFLAII